ncbi:MAG: metal ABC transporter permease [Bacteriovorax sp.]
MNGMISFLLAPFVMSLLLVAIHAYLGLHVIEREVIFVDISLSQVAALGAAVSTFFIHGEEENTFLTISVSLLFCLVSAFGLSILKKWEKKISQEVLIGLTYALASGLLILVLDRSPHGAEHIKEALVGNILFVTWKDVAITAVVYSIVGIFHFIFREKFWAATNGQIHSFLWDFFFYMLFGVVITFSTHHAGVLVVFVILVAPASIAKKLIENSKTKRLLVSWLIGIIGMLVAFIVSYKFDFPFGAGIVTSLSILFFGALLLLNMFVKNKN